MTNHWEITQADDYSLVAQVPETLVSAFCKWDGCVNLRIGADTMHMDVLDVCSFAGDLDTMITMLQELKALCVAQFGETFLIDPRPGSDYELVEDIIEDVMETPEEYPDTRSFEITVEGRYYHVIPGITRSNPLG